MAITNTSNITSVGTASQQNGDFLTFDGLSNNRFSIIIPSLPNVSFFIQKFSLPNVRVNQVELQTPIVDYNEIGEKLDFEPFVVTFMVDKYLRNYSEVFNWMKEMTVLGTNVGKTDDIVLKINNEDYIRFYGAWPTSLTGLDFDATTEEFKYIIAEVTLNYDYFDMIGRFATSDSSYK